MTVAPLWSAASRLTDPHHWPSLKQLAYTANVVWKRLVLSFELMKVWWRILLVKISGSSHKNC